MKDRYDVIVVGAGPAGSTAARLAAEGGAGVLLLEKDRDIGLPVRCAEGVGDKGLRSVVPVQERWISNVIKGVIFSAPNGEQVTVDSNEIGYVLNRKVFDYDLAEMAALAGATVQTRAYVYGLLHDNGTVTGVKVNHLGQDYQIAAKIVIGADGVESRVGRWAGLKTAVKMHDMETCVQVVAANIPINEKYCYFYFSKDIAPGGYLWVFPKGKNVANVGLGIAGDFSGKKSPLWYLRQFLPQHFPDAAILGLVAGGVPCAITLKKMVANGLMLIGDAAHQANPVSGGGIVSGMIAGKIAGEVAARAIAGGDASEKGLKAYPDAWNNNIGKQHRRFYRLKEAIYKLTDEDLNQTAALLNALPMAERTLFNIFKSALIKNPGLLVDVARAFL